MVDEGATPRLINYTGWTPPPNPSYGDMWQTIFMFCHVLCPAGREVEPMIWVVLVLMNPPNIKISSYLGFFPLAVSVYVSI